MYSTVKKLLVGDQNKRTLKKIEPLVEQINELEPQIQALSDDELRAKTDEFKRRYRESEQDEDETLEALLPEAFAVVRETARRLIGERHFDVQLMGGVILHRGQIAEMRTGEGKTLVATLPVYLNALTEKGAHVVTVNDYLARRDAAWMGQIYAFLGLTVGAINHDASYVYDAEHFSKQQEEDASEGQENTSEYKIDYDYLRPVSRKDAYLADITYGTNNEFGFDYLRDNIEYESENLRQRTPEQGGHHFAIVDEVDSILIDEARTPLIISAPAAESDSFYITFARIAQQLKQDEHYTVDEKLKAVQLTDEGIERAEEMLGVENIYTERGIKYVHHLETAVRAKALFERDKHYVVRDNEVVIVDEFTGRLQPGRRWSEGLHQAVEAKEGVAIQREQRTFASITFQNFFRQYRKLSGMTGTAMTSQEEFYEVYGLNVVSVPTNKPVQRSDHEDLIFQTEKGKFQALTQKVKELQERGQPVLIGTVSVEKNELLSAHLKREGIPHEVLNAKNHEREGEIIAQAGQRGRVTIATNMAGRGVDIKLGGNPASQEEYDAVKERGGLYVIGTERHDARRIDNQLRGRAGRQGDPGATQFFVSLEDTLMRVFASEMISNMMGRFGIPEDQPIENKYITRSLESAQSKIEGFNFDARKHVLQYDNVLSYQRQTIYDKRAKILLGDNSQVDEVLDEVINGDESVRKTVEERKQTLGEEAFYTVARRMLLQVIDLLWVEHLEIMDYLRSSVNLRAYGQRDPFIEYRKEALRLFKELEETFVERCQEYLPQMGENTFRNPQQPQTQEVHDAIKTVTQRSSGSEVKGRGGARQSERKIGRNEVVTITDGSQTKQMKYKKAEEYLQSGWQLAQNEQK